MLNQQLRQMSLLDQVKDLFGFPVKQTPSSPSTAAASIMRPQANYFLGVDAQFEMMVKHGWRKNEIIFACISKTAKTASQVELKVYVRGTKTELPDDKIKKLIQQPNPQMSEYDFWSCIITYQKLAGVAYFEKERNNAGEVVHLWPLRPDWVKVQMKSATEVGYYHYQPSGSSDFADLKPADVMVFRVWDPMGLYSYWPPAAVAARVGDTDNETTDMIKAFIQEGGLPVGLLSVPGRLRDDAAVEDIRSRWRSRYGGWKKWMDPAVLDNGATYQRMGLTFEEMGFGNLDSRNEARICMALDVPPILVSAKIGLDRSTYSNYKEARSAWWEDTLIPIYSDLLDVMINQLQDDFQNTDRIDIKWDFSRVPVMQEANALRWDTGLRGLQAGGLTVNEFREMVGLGNLGPQGDVFLRSPTLLPVPAKPSAGKSADGEEDAVAKTPACRQRGETTDECVSRKIPEIMHENPMMDIDQAIAIAHSMCGKECGKSENGNGKIHEHQHIDQKATTARLDLEELLAQDLVKYFKGQRDRIEEEVSAGA